MACLVALLTPWGNGLAVPSAVRSKAGHHAAAIPFPGPTFSGIIVSFESRGWRYDSVYGSRSNFCFLVFRSKSRRIFVPCRGVVVFKRAHHWHSYLKISLHHMLKIPKSKAEGGIQSIAKVRRVVINEESGPSRPRLPSQQYRRFTSKINFST